MDSMKKHVLPNEFELTRYRRRSRVASLPSSSLFGHSKKSQLVPAKALKTPGGTVRNIYTSRAVKEYRQRRAIHHKRVRTEQHKLTPKEEDVIKLKPIDQFTRIVKLVITLRKAFKSIVLYASEKGKYDQLNSETALSLKSTAAAKATVESLLFDPEDYKRHYQITLPKWAKDIAEKSPDMRTAGEVKLLMRLMRHLKGFRRYGHDMQFAVCKALRYDSFSRGRVVIRKSHIAQRFYFIYSGSVCVTVDDDEHSAFAKPTENAVLHRGDYFGELAFLRNLRRSATIVCLEKTELLSVDKEDFFSAKIDKCFSSDMERRVEFLRNHSLFSSWPQSVVRELAEVSRINECYSEEVLVRDSTQSSWLVLVTKGQCDVLRLLDLSSCPEYVSHCDKYRMELLSERATSRSSPNADRYSPKCVSIATHGESPAGVKASRSDMRIDRQRAPGLTKDYGNRNRTRSALPLTRKAIVAEPEKGSLLTGKRVPHLALSSDSHDKSPASGTPGDGIGVGVYMVLDRLRPGMCFGSWSILEDEESKTRKNKEKMKFRRFTLLSGGCEIIKISKEGFMKCADVETMEKLRHLTREYPSDARLCHTYLRHSDWRTYREELVDNLVSRHNVQHEAAKGSWRTGALRASPVPSPLCIMKPWQPTRGAWGGGTRPVVVNVEPSQGTIFAFPHTHTCSTNRDLNSNCTGDF